MAKRTDESAPAPEAQDPEAVEAGAEPDVVGMETPAEPASQPPAEEQPAEAQAQPEPQAQVFPSSMADSEQMVNSKRVELRRAEQAQADSTADVNRLRNEIDALNALRQAHGQQPA